jgi:hypothetical protein
MTALDHLRKLVDAISCSDGLHPCCEWIDDHAPDCPWTAAKTWLGEHDRQAEVNLARLRSEIDCRGPQP